MKKTIRNIFLVWMAALLILLLAYTRNNTDETVDYSGYSFTDTIWVRRAEHDIETIIFSSDGSFTYFCACGNPVNDSDLNEGYTYDDETKTITIKYIETTEETVPVIKIESYDDKNIKLNFDGEIREFSKEKN